LLLALHSGQINLIARHRDIHRRQAGREDEFRQIIAVSNEGEKAVGPPADGVLRRLDHVGERIPSLLSCVLGGAYSLSQPSGH